MPERVRVLPETLEYPPAEISESLPAIFGLARTLGPQDRQRVLARIVDAASTVNVPVLATSPDWNYGDGSLVFLDDQAQQIIKARTQHLVAAPYRKPIEFDALDQARLQTWLDGVTLGRTQGEIAQRCMVDPKTMQRVKGRLFEHLGVVNEAAAVYSMRLHGYTYALTHPTDLEPVWSPTQELQFYLAAIGFEEGEAAELAGTTPSAVSTMRSRIIHGFGAVTTPQAVMRAFDLQDQYYRPMSLAA